MKIASTIIPVFLVIFIGFVAGKRRLVNDHFLGPANRLVYFLAIPAMVFSAIAKTPFAEHGSVPVILFTLLAGIVAFVGAILVSGVMGLEKGRRGTFCESIFHCNLGYIGFAVVFYYMGETGLGKAGIIAGCYMILQNLLAVAALQYFGNTGSSFGYLRLFTTIGTNPVILSAAAGIIFSVYRIDVPLVFDRTLDILGRMALPVALLIIGASISPGRVKRLFFPVSVSAFFKLFFLPGLGLFMYRRAGIPAVDYLPGLILLASPTATVVYVLSRELKGDPDLAVATISFSTVVSSLSFIFWLGFGT